MTEEAGVIYAKKVEQVRSIPMFVPTDFPQALGLLFVSLVCWGSWGNSAKFSTLVFPQFYLLYGTSLFLWSAILGFVLGGDYYAQDSMHRNFIHNLRNATGDSILYAMASGAIFNVSNSLLAILIGLVGLSVSFPICIGISLIAGTLLSYMVQPAHTNFTLLCIGLLLALLALLCMAYAHHLKNSTPTTPDTDARYNEETHLVVGDYQPDTSSNAKTKTPLAFGRLILLCILCGGLMGCFSPLSTLAQDATRPGHLNPYTCIFFFTLSAMVTTLPLVYWLHHRPLDGVASGQSFWHGFQAAATMDKVWPVLGGLIWSLGTLLNFVSGNKVSFAIAYAIGQAAPVAAAFWGLFYFKEFKGAPMLSFVFMGLMFVFYGSAVGFIASSSSVK